MTERQQKLRDYIAAYINQHGTPPLRKEMAHAMETTESAITWLVMQLELAGVVQRGARHRSLRLLK
jgi:SOS-response transcriptional repressor LexA